MHPHFRKMVSCCTLADIHAVNSTHIDLIGLKLAWKCCVMIITKADCIIIYYTWSVGVSSVTVLSTVCQHNTFGNNRPILHVSRIIGTSFRIMR